MHFLSLSTAWVARLTAAPWVHPTFCRETPLPRLNDSVMTFTWEKDWLFLPL